MFPYNAAAVAKKGQRKVYPVKSFRRRLERLSSSL